jgi:hypothetical protein
MLSPQGSSSRPNLYFSGKMQDSSKSQAHQRSKGKRKYHAKSKQTVALNCPNQIQKNHQRQKQKNSRMLDQAIFRRK